MGASEASIVTPFRKGIFLGICFIAIVFFNQNHFGHPVSLHVSGLYVPHNTSHHIKTCP
jgi:hypothetical protein